ncbi:hypothetical protein BD769DRAFT_1391405 [Suillus cothurnatus]|nr:hypothetical protein BD769DRAFT_1391405 [Suillus cothurnatus]
MAECMRYILPGLQAHEDDNGLTLVARLGLAVQGQPILQLILRGLALHQVIISRHMICGLTQVVHKTLSLIKLQISSKEGHKFMLIMFLLCICVNFVLHLIHSAQKTFEEFDLHTGMSISYSILLEDQLRQHGIVLLGYRKQ